jgi:hypothetical protein
LALIQNGEDFGTARTLLRWVGGENRFDIWSIIPRVSNAPCFAAFAMTSQTAEARASPTHLGLELATAIHVEMFSCWARPSRLQAML